MISKINSFRIVLIPFIFCVSHCAAQNQIGIEVQPTFSYTVDDIFKTNTSPPQTESDKSIYVVPNLFYKMACKDQGVLFLKLGYFKQNWSQHFYSSDNYNIYSQDLVEKHDNVFFTCAYGKSFKLGPVGIDFGLQCPFTFHLNENFSYTQTQQVTTSLSIRTETGALKNSIEAGLGSYLAFTANLWGKFNAGFSLSYNYSFWKRTINFAGTDNYYDNGTLTNNDSYTEKKSISTFQSSDFFPSILLSYSIRTKNKNAQPEGSKTE